MVTTSKIRDLNEIVEINQTLRAQHNLQIGIALGDWDSKDGTIVPWCRLFFWKYDEQTGQRELWSPEAINSMLDEMQTGAKATEESAIIAGEIVELISGILCSMESLFEVRMVE